MTCPEPRYLGENGEPSTVFRPAATAPDVVSGNNRTHYLATHALTGGDFGLYRVDMDPKAPGPSAHFHRTISESFFVLSGEVGLHDGERWTTAGEGDFLHVPAGGLHGFRNDGDTPASLLILFAPGAPRVGAPPGRRLGESTSSGSRRCGRAAATSCGSSWSGTTPISCGPDPLTGEPAPDGSSPAGATPRHRTG